MQPGNRILARAPAFRGAAVINRGRSALARAGLALGVLAAAAAGTVLAGAGPAGAAAASTTALRPLAFTPSGHNFGPVTVGQTAQQKFTLKNNSSTTSSRLTVSHAGSARFSITAGTCAGIRLQPGKTCTVTVRFAPTATGAVTGTLKAAGTSRAATASLAGTGGGYLYWSNYQNGTINRANLDGTGVTTLVSGQTDPIAVAVDSSHIYWANYNGTINSAPLTGGTATTLVTGQSDPDAVAVYGGRLYWANLGNGTIDEANLNGTGVTTLASGQAGPQGLAISPS